MLSYIFVQLLVPEIFKEKVMSLFILINFIQNIVQLLGEVKAKHFEDNIFEAVSEGFVMFWVSTLLLSILWSYIRKLELTFISLKSTFHDD